MSKEKKTGEICHQLSAYDSYQNKCKLSVSAWTVSRDRRSSSLSCFLSLDVFLHVNLFFSLLFSLNPVKLPLKADQCCTLFFTANQWNSTNTALICSLYLFHLPASTASPSPDQTVHQEKIKRSCKPLTINSRLCWRSLQTLDLQELQTTWEKFRDVWCWHLRFTLVWIRDAEKILSDEKLKKINLNILLPLLQKTSLRSINRTRIHT